MGGLADGGVIHAQIAADRAHYDLARVEADANLHGDTVGVASLLRISLHGLLHTQRGVASSRGMILVSDWRAKEGHDAVAHDLIHRALVAVHRLYHAVEDRIEDPSRLLGIAISKQLHGALQVSEEHGHLLALAFEGGLRGEDLLSEVLRRVRLGRDVSTGGGHYDRLTALEAEAG